MDRAAGLLCQLPPGADSLPFTMRATEAGVARPEAGRPGAGLRLGKPIRGRFITSKARRLK